LQKQPATHALEQRMLLIVGLLQVGTQPEPHSL